MDLGFECLWDGIAGDSGLVTVVGRHEGNSLTISASVVGLCALVRFW